MTPIHQLTLALLVLLSTITLLATGCKESTGFSSDEDQDLLDVSADRLDSPDDGVSCCTPPECIADGLVCNPETCLCEDWSGRCEVHGGECDPASEQPDGFHCQSDDASESGHCLLTCSPTRKCPDELLCDRSGVCHEGPLACRAFQRDSDCPDGYWCRPNSTREAEEADFPGTCIPDNGESGAEDERCESIDGLESTCGNPAGLPRHPELVCVSSSAGSTCMQMCDPNAGSGDPGSCPDGRGCFAEEVILDDDHPAWGLCRVLCDPCLQEDPACANDEECRQDSASTDVPRGGCWPASDHAPHPPLDWECDSNPDTPFPGCEPGEECSNGMCTAETCRVDGQETLDICGEPTGPGQCTLDNAFCSPLVVDGMDLELGTCITTCEYNRMDRFSPTVPCPGDEVCQFAAMIGHEPDVCVDYGERLDAPPLAELEDCPEDSEFAHCRPGGLCLEVPDLTVGIQCVELCDFELGAAGTIAHADCSRTDATCTDEFGWPGVGVCK